MENHNHHEDSFKEYIKFGVLMAIIFGASYYFASAFGTGALTDYLRFFMGIFFVAFATFKLWNLEQFVVTFAVYDIIAKKQIAYAYAFPFIQLFLGVLYLTNTGGALRDIFTIAVTSIGAYSVIQQVYLKKHRLSCACLGSIIKLPLSSVTLIEDLGMAAMALMMFVE